MTMKTINDTARINIAAVAIANYKLSTHKLIFGGLEINKNVLQFLINNEDTYNAFNKIIEFIDSIKPLPKSKIELEYDNEMDTLFYYIDIPETMPFEEYMKYSDNFFDFISNNFPFTVSVKNNILFKFKKND